MLTHSSNIILYCLLFCYALFFMLSLVLPLATVLSWLSFCGLMIYLPYKYSHSPKVEMRCSNIFRLVFVLILVCALMFASLAMGTSSEVRALQNMLFAMLMLWITAGDYAFSLFGLDLSKDLASAVGMCMFISSVLVGTAFLLEAFVPPSKTGNINVISVLVMMNVLCLNNVVASMKLTTFISGYAYSTVMFGIQVYITFALEFVFLSSSLTALGFWGVLFWTNSYYLFRNTGGVEDVEEWFKIRYEDTWMAKYISYATKCSIHDIKITPDPDEDNGTGALVQTKEERAEERNRVYILKTQSELIQIVSPFVMVVAVAVDVAFVAAGVA